MKKKDYWILIGILASHLALLLILKFTAWPEMSLWPYLMSKGWMPYRDIAIAHTPLMLFDLTIFYKIFGSGILTLKIFTWITILVSDTLVFFIVKKLWNIKTAFISLMAYGLWLIFYDGNGLWFDLYMGVLAFCSFYFARSKKWLWTGIFWALAFISKQTAVWFLIPIGLEIFNNLRRPLRVRPYKVLVSFTKGVAFVAALFTLLLIIFNLLPDFWNWAVKFGVFILPKAQGQIQLPTLKNLAVTLFPFVVFLFLMPKSKFINLALWALAGVVGVYPRFEYFHFQPAIFYLAITSGLFFTNINFKKMKAVFKVFVVVYLFGAFYLFGTFFIRNIGEGTRFYEGDVQEVVQYVKYNTNPGDRIFVLNWWDNIYALTGTLPSTDPWIPQLSWYTEIPGIQEKMIEDLTVNPPKLIVFKPYTNFGLSSYIPEKVYNYVMTNYKSLEKVDGLVILVRRQYASR